MSIYRRWKIMFSATVAQSISRSTPPFRNSLKLWCSLGIARIMISLRDDSRTGIIIINCHNVFRHFPRSTPCSTYAREKRSLQHGVIYVYIIMYSVPI